MPSIAIKDATGATVFMSATGSGTIGDPYLVQHAISGRAAVEPLGTPNLAQSITTSASSQLATLNAATTRVSVYAVAATRYAVGTGTPVATPGSHFIAAGERLDFAVPASGKIAVLQDSAAGKFEITEYA